VRRVACLLALAAGIAAGAARGDELVVVRAGRVITVTGEEHAPGVVVIRDGEIEVVGGRVEAPPGARLVQAPGLVVMPGFVNPRSRFALPGYDRKGNLSHLRVADELLLREGELRPLLRAGYVATGLVPAGEGLPGQAAVCRTADGAVVGGGGYLRLRLRELPGEKRLLRAAFAGARQAIEREEKARAEWEKRKAAAEAKRKKKEDADEQGEKGEKGEGGDAAAGGGEGEGEGEGEGGEPAAEATPAVPAFEPPEVPPPLRAFVALLKEGADAPRLLIELGGAAQLLHLRDLGEEALAGAALQIPLGSGRRAGTDLHEVVAELAEGEPLIVCAPNLSEEAYTRTVRNLPAELTAAGARVAFEPAADDVEGHEAVLAAVSLLHRAGLPRDAALAGLTRHPAELLGLADDLGTLEAGRRADLVFLDGDPLAPGTAVERVWIAGREVWRAE